MENIQSFFEKAVQPVVYENSTVTFDSRSKEQQDLIATATAGRTQFSFHWTLKSKPMSFGLPEVNVEIGLVELNYENDVNETLAFDLSNYSVETKFEQRSKGKFGCLICDEAQVILDENRLLFIFSI